MSIPLWPQCTHLVMAVSSRIMHQLRTLKSSQTSFLNMTVSSQMTSTVSVQQSSVGMGGNGWFASWKCRWQICNNCMMPSCQYGAKYLRNVWNILFICTYITIFFFITLKLRQYAVIDFVICFSECSWQFYCIHLRLFDKKKKISYVSGSALKLFMVFIYSFLY